MGKKIFIILRLQILLILTCDLAEDDKAGCFTSLYSCCNVTVTGDYQCPVSLPRSAVDLLSPPVKYFTDGASFCGSFLLFMFRVCHAVMPVHSALWSPAGNG